MVIAVLGEIFLNFLQPNGLETKTAPQPGTESAAVEGPNIFFFFMPKQP
jgi:hypothetical protein